MPCASDQHRNLSNLIRLGTIAEVDLAGARCRVQSGDMQTDFLPWLVPAAGALIVWAAPSLGEQVLVLSPDGETMSGVVLRGLYSDAFAAPETSADVTLLRFGDGALISYDAIAHSLVATLPAGGTAELTADGGVTINGPLTVNGATTVNGNTTINGDEHVSGTVTADTDVVGGNISLKDHLTTGVTNGSSTSGRPK
ncbi:phage baseplate assembly protein V [Xanthomonas graminis]|uniref:phage baseplate assembly protein V n=1 Tax=Xanthomonas graminis TaxID=3390026 RepID=UPI001F030147|nr:phage baseplate assembly protein V [Xanthomonas translucens]UKE73221.1 phage baseplate assembly protein V [Xanthomonas translucens pv. phleipratensis]